MERLTSEEICKVVDFLIGETEPAADQAIDDVRLENLKTLIDISHWAMYRLYRVSEYRTSSYYSCKGMGEKAYSEMMELKEYFEDEETKEWNTHEVACILADLMGDNCACNCNGIDEWLPYCCDFADKECPDVVGVACWEQYLKHIAEKREVE